MGQKTILMTGATGFLGSHLLEGLLREGYRVVALKRSVSDVWRIGSYLKSKKIVCYDIDEVSLNKVFEEHQIDVAIHLATLYKKYEEAADVKEMLDTNITFPSQLLVLAAKNNIKGFINTGTFFEYDCSKPPVREVTAVKPFNFYARTKIGFESILKTYIDSMHVYTFKLFSPYGERDNNKLLPFVIKKGLAKEGFDLSEGLQKIDLIYCKDIVRAYLAAVELILSKENTRVYNCYNIGSGFPLSIRDIVSIIEGELGHRLKVRWGNTAIKDNSIVFADISKAKKQLGWQPSISAIEGIKATIDYYRAKNTDDENN